MKIRRFEIDRLYDRYSIVAQLNPDVNILVGNNGSFKSTVLEILHSMLRSGKMQGIYKMAAANADFIGPKAYIAYRTAEGTIEELEKRSVENNQGAEILQQVRAQTREHLPEDVVIRVDQFGYSLNGAGCSQSDFESVCHTDLISTFDNKGETDGKQSLLDIKLEKLQSDYSYYLSDLTKQMTDIISREGSISKGEMDRINSKKNLMLRFVNESFSKTGKELVPDQSRLTFRFKDGRTIHCESLSAGEKQLMIILLSVLLERDEKYIVFLDEPEISLHIDWQYQLIEMLTSLNPNAQFVLTTHSPGIFADGWGDRIIYMEDIVQEVVG